MWTEKVAAKICSPGDPTTASTDPRFRLFLCNNIGLAQVRGLRDAGILEPADLDALGVSIELAGAIEQWVNQYTIIAASLPYGYSPQDCIEFEIDIYNRVGRDLAEVIATLFDDRWTIELAPLVRKKCLYISSLMDRFRPYDVTKKRLWGDGTAILDTSNGPPECDVFPNKWLRVALFPWSGGVWDIAGTERMCASLPLEAQLADELDQIFETLCERWAAIEENFERGTVSERAYENARALIAAQGLRAALRLKAVLPEDWAVVYFDIEQAARRAWRPAFEYRI